MRTLAYLALLQNFVRIQALKMALIGATIIMLTEGSSMAATITVHARHETHRYDGRRPMIKLVVTALVAAIMVIALALAARAQTPYLYILPPVKYDHPFTGILTIHIAKDTKEVQAMCDLPTPRVACGYVHTNWCRIIIVKDDVMRAMGWNPLHIWRHEHAHCHKPDGWSNKHEGIRAHSPQDDARWMQTYDIRDLYRSNPHHQPKAATNNGPSDATAAKSPSPALWTLNAASNNPAAVYKKNVQPLMVGSTAQPTECLEPLNTIHGHRCCNAAPIQKTLHGNTMEPEAYAALETIRRGQPFAPPPAELKGEEIDLTVPIRFNWRDPSLTLSE